MIKPLLTALLLLPLMAAAAESPTLHYRFDSVPDGVVTNVAGPELAGSLKGGAQIAPIAEGSDTKALSLDGKTGLIEVKGAENLHIGPEGLSFVATVRFADDAKGAAPSDAKDMILFKGDEFLFGRDGSNLYFNLHDGKGWKSHVLAGPVPHGEWCHLAVIVKRNYEPSQGVNGYTVQLFLNGEALKSAELPNRETPATTNPVSVGKGFGGPWFFHGDIAELAVYPRAILEGELNALLAKEKLAKVKFRHVAAPDPRYAGLLAEIRAGLAGRGPDDRRSCERLLAAVGQAGNLVGSQTELLPFLETVKVRFASDGFWQTVASFFGRRKNTDPLAEFAAAHPQFTFLDNEQLGLTFFSPRPDNVALCGIFDFAAGRELLGEQGALWALRHEPPGGGALLALDSAAPTVRSSLSVDREKREAVLEWKQSADKDHPFAFTARSKLRMAGSRLSLNLDVRNESPNVALREVVFPTIQLRRLANGLDRLLVPMQSGVVNENPVAKLFKYEGKYPSGPAHMQFFSYYDERQGTYVACEDPLGRTKNLLATAVADDCKLSFLWFVGCPAGAGGNGFVTSGEAVVATFAGDWFDAAQIYKKFARTAAWWPASRTREDTPEWYRNLSVWFQTAVNTDEQVADLIAIRNYLELPVGAHAYNWSEAKWPPFTGHPYLTPPKPGFEERVAQLQAHSVHVKPYINARIWDTREKDKEITDPESSEFLNSAKPSTVKLRDQSVAMEKYAKRSFAAMCPATPFWQDTVKQLSATVAGYGVDAIYFDQIGAAAPPVCFDATHPHAPGSGETWLEQGYWPMLSAIRKELKPLHPQLAFDTEDAAEPYMNVLDGFLPWRFVYVGHVPAHQAIYAGRAQMTGRVNTAQPKAKFVVAAEQMLFGEQIGWFGPSSLTKDPQLGLFVKKLAHTRQAFLPFFNEGDMLKPATWASPMPTITADWGYYGPRIITTPALMHSAWRLGDMTAIVVVNTSPDSVTADLVPPAKAWGLPDKVTVTELQEKQQPKTATGTTANSERITVPGYSVASWIIGSGCDTAPVAEIFSKIGKFEPPAAIAATPAPLAPL